MKTSTVYHSKKPLVIGLLLVILVVVITVGATMAYFTNSNEITNTFVMGNVDVSLKEPNWKEDDGLKIKPGVVRQKDPTVTAEKGQCYMRVRMEILDGEGKLITDENRINIILKTLWYDTDLTNLKTVEQYNQAQLEQMLAEGKINKEYNKDAFVFAGIEEGKPAARYYNYIANKGIFDADKKDTATLFTNFVIPTDWDNKKMVTLSGDTFEETESGIIEVIQKGTGYKIQLTAQAIQSSEMKSPDDAFRELNISTKVTIDASKAER